MTVTVRLFAILRERAGRDSVEIELPDDATVADAFDRLAAVPGLDELVERMPLRMAVNREYADANARIAPGDELAVIPPISGGAEENSCNPEGDKSSGDRGRTRASVTEEALSAERLSEWVGDPGAGAIITFQGVTREVASLDYESYREMAEERIAAILAEAVERHGLIAAAAEHRVGRVPRGEPGVVVAVSAGHRGEAFDGAREAIDRIKAEAPIWKRELDAAGEGAWVDGAAPAAGEDAGPADACLRMDDKRRGCEGAGDVTHLGDDGRARMVDVGGKPTSERRAVARARLRMARATARAVERGDGPKGEVLGVARIAGVQAAKQTATLIPLCHPLPLSFVDVTATVDTEAGLVELLAEARTVGQTGVEMEAMTAASVAALTVYDMVKGLERGVAIESVVLLSKSGGRSGEWRLDEGAAD